MAFGIDSILNLGAAIIDRVWPDPTEAAKAKLALLEMQQKGELATLDADLQIALAQSATNTAEAASGNKFASSWRPLIGYVCAAALAYNFILYPLLAWLTALWPELHYPPRFTDGLMELVLGMLGLAGFRTYEKTKGAAK